MTHPPDAACRGLPAIPEHSSGGSHVKKDYEENTMKQYSSNTTGSRRRTLVRFGTKALLFIAAFLIVVSMSPLQALAEDSIQVDSNTHTMNTGTYVVNENVTISPDNSTGNGIRVEKGAKVFLYIESGKTLTVTGNNAGSGSCGCAAILLPEGSTLTIAGKGTLNATGGNAGNGSDGGNAMKGFYFPSSGDGGDGGKGGGGAGAGIGTNGGEGGNGAKGPLGAFSEDRIKTNSNVYGKDGNSGSAGQVASGAGTVIVTGSVTVNAKGGKAGYGGRGGARGHYFEERYSWNAYAAGTSGGGGGGGGGSAADGIGSGGTGGGGGGSGGSGNIDGECAFLTACNLDDLWSYGGYGGSGVWGGGRGQRGDYGASNGGDSTGASESYAKSGGAGGSSPAPRTVAFYAYDNRNITCTSGHGETRSATWLPDIQSVQKLGGYSGLVTGGTVKYDGKEHGVTVSGSNTMSTQAAGTGQLSEETAYNALRTQGNGKPDEYDEYGEVTVGSVPVEYWITYYDASGRRVGNIPVMPGQYAAVIKFMSDDEQYKGDWVEPFAISKIQVEKPTPAALTFECADWYTGEGTEQDAFPELDETYYVFDPDAKLGDKTESKRSAKTVGSYQACFRLKDPDTCEWAGESEDSEEVWIPWSIAVQEFDANDPEVTYWGTDPGNETTTVDYTGEPIWVRPWWTPAKDIGGKFPEWFTHWGAEDRPTTNRLSSAVFYVKGDDDREGLVGYHTKKDGTFEPVTAEQVYAWVNGVEIDGENVAVQNGDKIWYKKDKDGWKVPLAVGGDRPAGAEGYVIARDYAYADRLGVMEAGTYQAYAIFDDGAGFAQTSLAEATVTVNNAKNAGAKKAATGDHSNVEMWYAICISAAAVLILMASVRLRRRSARR